MNRISFLSVLLAGIFAAISPSEAQFMDLMTYNIKYDNPDDGQDSWDARKDRVVGQLRFYHPAVFGIQEGLNHQVNYLQQKLPGYDYVGVGRDDGKTAGEYSALFYDRSVFKRIRHNTFWLSNTPGNPSVGWDAALERICTLALLEHRASKKRLWVFNTHFDHVGEKARYRSAKLILEKIRTLNKEGFPVVLMGDLNAEPKDPPIQAISRHMDDARVVSRDPAFGPEGTYNGFDFNRPVTRRIDYIFVKGVDVLKYAVLSDPEDLHYPSDHFPVLARIQL